MGGGDRGGTDIIYLYVFLKTCQNYGHSLLYKHNIMHIIYYLNVVKMQRPLVFTSFFYGVIYFKQHCLRTVRNFLAFFYFFKEFFCEFESYVANFLTVILDIFQRFPQSKQKTSLKWSSIYTLMFLSHTINLLRKRTIS